KVIVSSSQDDTIKFWEASTGVLLETLVLHQGDVSVVLYSPNGQLLASASDDDSVRLWALEDGISR
ncbi:MAG: serine/threonine protein kinase, partial [Pseudomonadota bacterium]